MLFSAMKRRRAERAPINPYRQALDLDSGEVLYLVDFLASDLSTTREILTETELHTALDHSPEGVEVVQFQFLRAGADQEPAL